MSKKKCPHDYKANLQQDVDTKKNKALLQKKLSNNEITETAYINMLKDLIKKQKETKITKDIMVCNVNKCNALDSRLTHIARLAQNFKNPKINTEIRRVQQYLKSKPFSIEHYIKFQAEMMSLINLIAKA